MNEIEKLYENAGIKPYIYCSKPRLDCNARETGNCQQDCEYYSGKRLLTPFTAEKQIELIKFLFNHNVYYDVDEKGNYWFHISDEIENSKYREFNEAIAECINKMWQDLTEEEKEQFKYQIQQLFKEKQ